MASYFDDHNQHQHHGHGDEAGDAASVASKTDNEYYNFLHVARTASQDEITAAYKKMSRLYHPDKHREESKKQQAEIMFAKLKTAYEGNYGSMYLKINLNHLFLF